MTPAQIIAVISTSLDLLERLTGILEALSDDEISAEEIKAIKDRARKADERIDAIARRAGIIK